MPSRRELIALTDDEIQTYLQESQTLIIVSNGPDGYPHPMPMWYHVDDEGFLYVTTFEKSQKVFNFKRDPRAALLVESGTVYEELKSVLIYAHAEVITDPEVILDILVAKNSKGQTLDDAGRAKLRASVAKTAQKRVVIKFIPERYVTWDHRKLGGKY